MEAQLANKTVQVQKNEKIESLCTPILYDTGSDLIRNPIPGPILSTTKKAVTKVESVCLQCMHTKTNVSNSFKYTSMSCLGVTFVTRLVLLSANK